MKKIILTMIFIFVMGSAMGCQKQEEQAPQPVSEEKTVTTAEVTEEDSSTDSTEESQTENTPAIEVEGKDEDLNGQGTAEADQSGAGNKADDGESTDSDAAPQSYYGKWKVTQYYAAYITALSTEEMNAQIGTECEYGADTFISGGKELDSPQYSESEEKKADFEADYQGQPTFEIMGITADAVKQISIDNSYDFGSMFYVKDANTIIIIYEGVFFEAVRE